MKSQPLSILRDLTHLPPTIQDQIIKSILDMGYEVENKEGVITITPTCGVLLNLFDGDVVKAHMGGEG